MNNQFSGIFLASFFYVSFFYSANPKCIECIKMIKSIFFFFISSMKPFEREMTADIKGRVKGGWVLSVHLASITKLEPKRLTQSFDHHHSPSLSLASFNISPFSRRHPIYLSIYPSRSRYTSVLLFTHLSYSNFLQST